MITECPDTPIATSFCLIRSSLTNSWVAWTIASGGSGFIPKLWRAYTTCPRRRCSLSWIIFTDVDPISNPIANLPFAIPAPRLFSCAPGMRGDQVPKNFLPVAYFQSESKNDLALGIHPAALAALDPIDRQHRDARPPGELCFGHQLILPQAPHIV